MQSPDLDSSKSPSAFADNEQPWKRLTFVTGQGRSGTTWLGELIGQHPRVRYVFEPFSPAFHQALPTDEVVRGVLGSHLLDPDAQLGSDWVFEGEARQRLAQFQPMFLAHLAGIVRMYFGDEKIDHLVVKQPAAEKVGWLVDTLGPSKIVWIPRHPAGIIASHIRWSMFPRRGDKEFSFALRAIEEDYPEIVALFDGPKSSIERLALLLLVKGDLAARQLAGEKVHRLDYEALCADPARELSGVFRYLGMKYDADLIEKCLTRVRTTPARSKALRLDVDSRKRSCAWRRELSPSRLRKIAGAASLVGCAIPLPGAGLPPLSLWERLSATFREWIWFCRQMRSRVSVRRILGRARVLLPTPRRQRAVEREGQ